MGRFPSFELTPTSWKRDLSIPETWLHHCVSPVMLRSASAVVVLQGLAVTGTNSPAHIWAVASWEHPPCPSPGHKGLPPCPGSSSGLSPCRDALMGSSGCWFFLPRLLFLEVSTSSASAQISWSFLRFQVRLWHDISRWVLSLHPLPCSSSHIFPVLLLKQNCCSWVATSISSLLLNCRDLGKCGEA